MIDGGIQSPGLFVSESTARGGRSLRVNVDEHVPTFHVDIMKLSDAYTDAIVRAIETCQSILQSLKKMLNVTNLKNCSSCCYKVLQEQHIFTESISRHFLSCII